MLTETTVKERKRLCFFILSLIVKLVYLIFKKTNKQVFIAIHRTQCLC